MIMDFSKEAIDRALGPNMWDFGNGILYYICRNVPLHVSEEEIMGKVWLIGRSYAAAIERGVSRKGDSFYKDDVAVTIKAVGKELDDRIGRLRTQTTIDRELLNRIVETHGFLTEVLKEISGINNRSLASKYLHFHAPYMFYIYDSRAISAVTKLKTLDRDLKRQLKELDGNDGDYVDLVAKIYPLSNRIYEEHGVQLTPRQLDVLLLNY